MNINEMRSRQMMRMGHEFPEQLQKGAGAESLAPRGDGIWEEQRTGARNLETSQSQDLERRERFQEMGQRTHRKVRGKLAKIRK